MDMAIQQATRNDRPAGAQRMEIDIAPRSPGRYEQNGRLERRSEAGREERLAGGLGWFSIGLGLAQVAAPGAAARLIGVPGDDKARSLMRGLGLRELAAGLGILSRPRPAGWLWARVAGDAMDLALLGAALGSNRVRRGRVAAATAAVVGVTALDLLSAVQLGRLGAATQGHKEDRGMHVKKAITVNRSPEEVYRFWHDFQNLPRFMDHLESVQVTGERRSHWKAKAPAGRTVEWDAEVVEDRPNELIAWRSLEGADVDNSGSVHFAPAPGDRGTEVHVELRYDPPGGAIGATIAKLFGEEPAQQVNGDLRRFKQVMELGEVVQSEATVHGRPHPAQPPKEPVRAR
jgi:uncharacterized membrane protein